MTSTGPSPGPSPSAGASAHPALREGLVLLTFALLTVAMTWPWAAMIRDGVPDPGDPYLTSWILWWDWHATFTDPLSLFHPNVLFPYRWALAFSEHDYGLALPLFPLFFLGARPLTVHAVGMLLGYLLSGYGAFRLARTMTGSTGAAWVAGIAFAFVPYRFHQVSHLVYTFAAWVPLVLEALVLFLRKRSWPRAAWLGVAFLMNGLTCIHWLVLSALPLAVAGAFLALREGLEKDRALLVRGGAALGGASLLLLPFLVPYTIAAKLYGFERSAGDALDYSARFDHWLTADPLNRLWSGLGVVPAPGELALFPGLVMPLLALAAVLLSGPDRETREPAQPGRTRPGLVRFLDVVAVAAGTIALLASSPTGLVIRREGEVVFSARDPVRAFAVLAVALLLRWLLAWPSALPFRGRSLLDSVRLARRPDAVVVGLSFAVLGFLGSFGMRLPFHATLFALLPPFRSIRVPARWAMMADLGLALLAGLGAVALARAAAVRWPGRRWVAPSLFAGLCALLLFEQRAAPLPLVHGEADPDDVTAFLARAPMRGGIVDLPTTFPGPYEAMLRAADHRKPLVNAVSGFTPPTVETLERLLAERPIPDALLDHLESIPASYVVVHESRLTPQDHAAMRDFLTRGVASGRLRFVGRFDGRRKNDVYAVAKTEPSVAAVSAPPWDLGASLKGAGPSKESDGLPGSIDDPGKDSTVHGRLLVRGWAREEGGDLDVAILLDGDVRTPDAFRRVPRPDVARALPKLGACGTAGWEAEFELRKGDEGKREIRAVFRAADGRYRYYPLRTFDWQP